jgi:hypothetical protein
VESESTVGAVHIPRLFSFRMLSELLTVGGDLAHLLHERLVIDPQPRGNLRPRSGDRASGCWRSPPKMAQPKRERPGTLAHGRTLQQRICRAMGRSRFRIGLLWVVDIQATADLSCLGRSRSVLRCRRRHRADQPALNREINRGCSRFSSGPVTSFTTMPPAVVRSSD